MSWQQYKDDGNAIYQAQSEYRVVRLKKIYRVIHNNNGRDLKEKRCVRFNNKWHALHEPEELLPVMSNAAGIEVKVYLGNLPLEETDPKLPFLLEWEKPGGNYPVYGY